MDFASFASSPPRFHSWDGGKTWIDGGFSTYHLGAIYRFCRQRLPTNATILETGAGNSTVCFLFSEPGRLLSIAPDQELFDRITDYCETNRISMQPIEMYVEGSQWALPRLASGHEIKLDLAMIDGLHNYPMAMLDFFYINTMLKKGGFLMLDDIHVHSVAELFRTLSYQSDRFKLIDKWSKLGVFEKLSDEPELDEWHMQPYVFGLSGYRTGPLLHRIINTILRIRRLKQNELGWK
jgi:hypothetical protein